MTKNLAIFASGSGSNTENLVNYFYKNSSAKVQLILSNKAESLVLERAKRLEVPFGVFSKSEFEDGKKILSILDQYKINFIILAGFLLRIAEPLLHVYSGKIINIHPALLPKYGGKGMYGDKIHEAVICNKETETGITIHYINENYDEGQIIKQVSCPVFPTDSATDVATRVHALEYEHYPKVIEEIINSL